MIYENIQLLKVLVPTVVAFLMGIFFTPYFTTFFYKNKLWKRSSRIDDDNKRENGNGVSQEFAEIHNEAETNTPRLGGMIVWFSVLITVCLFFFLSYYFPETALGEMNFINREQTLLPLMSLIAGALLGLIDDLLQIFGNIKQLAIGIPRRIRIFSVLGLGLIEGLWFFNKLGQSSIELPFTAEVLSLGILFVPFFMLVVLALFSSSVIDGVDGLAGGVLAIIFAAYGVIGVIQDQFSIAAFCFVVVGALLSFVWFNIPPARFYFGESGILALMLSLSIIIFLTNTVVEFIIIGMPLVITSGSALIQIISRRFFNKKVFLVAPLHHHFEAKGWSRAKITMRYWVFSLVSASLGIIVVIIG